MKSLKDTFDTDKMEGPLDIFIAALTFAVLGVLALVLVFAIVNLLILMVGMVFA